MYTSDAQDAQHPQQSKRLPRRPRIAALSPVPISSPTGMPSDNLENTNSTTPSLDIQGVPSADSFNPSSMTGTASYASAISAPVTPLIPVSPVPDMPSTPSASQVYTTPTAPLISPFPALPASSVRVVDPSLKLPSISRTPPRTTLPANAPSPEPNATENADNAHFEHAIDFATHSWDLATGGLKTMTAKRELPTRMDRKSLDLPVDESLERTARNYTFALVILVCIILMLIGSGVILFVILQQ